MNPSFPVTILGGVVATRQFPSRLVASGTLTLAPGATADYSGLDGKQARRQFIITNLSATMLKLQADGQTFCTVPAATATEQPTVLTFEVSGDIRVYNPSATETVSYEVGGIFYDAGAAGSSVQAAAAAAGVTASAAGSGGSAPAGGGSGGGGGGGGFTPSGYGTRQTQQQ